MSRGRAFEAGGQLEKALEVGARPACFGNSKKAGAAGQEGARGRVAERGSRGCVSGL